MGNNVMWFACLEGKKGVRKEAKKKNAFGESGDR